MKTFMQMTRTCKRNQYNWMENYQKITFLSSVESNINTGTIVFVINTNIFSSLKIVTKTTATTLVCNFNLFTFFYDSKVLSLH